LQQASIVFDLHQKGYQDSAKIWSVKRGLRAGKPIFDLALGLKWTGHFCKNSFALTLKAGYEYHWYMNQNQFLLSNNNTSHELFNPLGGDLTFQGAIGSIQFDF
jgi:hypothetical protein